MIIVARPDVSEADLDLVRERVEALGLRTYLARGGERITVVCTGGGASIPVPDLQRLPGVERILQVDKPYPLAAREALAGTSVVRLGHGTGGMVGGAELAVVAGPAAVEGRDALLETAKAMRAAGAGVLHVGSLEPQATGRRHATEPGLTADRLQALSEVRAETGLAVVVEVLDTRQVEVVAGHADVLRIGAGNMQNFALLQEVGRVSRPVVLERGASATVEELLLAAEHVMTHGSRDVVLCERGIRTFEIRTRDPLDLGVIPLLKAETHLPVVVDPSHAARRAELVAPLAFAAVAAGADGLVLEVDAAPEPVRAGVRRPLTPDELAQLLLRLRPFCEAAGRTLAPPPFAPGEVAA